MAKAEKVSDPKAEKKLQAGLKSLDKKIGDTKKQAKATDQEFQKLMKGLEKINKKLGKSK